MPPKADPKRLTDYPDNGTFKYFDTETTGLSPQKDRVISLGIVTVVNGKITAEQEWFFNPGGVKVEAEALAVHGITDHFLKDKPPIQKELGEILGLVMDSVMAGHNVAFDLKFMDAECRRFNLPTFSEVMLASLCTLAMSKERWPGKKATLDSLLDRLKVDRKHRTSHGALLDAKLGAVALIQMGHRQMDIAGFAPDQAPTPKVEKAVEADTGMPAIVVLKANDDELAEHASYMADLDKEIKGASVWTALDNPAAAPVQQVVVAPPVPYEYADVESTGAEVSAEAEAEDDSLAPAM